MRHHLAALALAPVLLAQGLRVRRVTPRLPEPPGPRSGTAGSGPPLRLLIAGDSAAAGVGAASQAQALSGAVVDALSDHFRVSWTLNARTGLRIAGVIARLAAATPEPFDVALLSVGVNDVTAFTPTRTWLVQQGQLVALLKSRFGVRHVLLTSLPPMHAFPALPDPLRWYLGARARELSARLVEFAAGDAACEVVSPRLPLDPAYMAADGFHPGPLAYLEWGRTVADIVVRRESSRTSRG
jgi:lysophospholipase L1-like esterase